jgi:prepilin-type N-terminal cleavage/methylation domain-containing protein
MASNHIAPGRATGRPECFTRYFMLGFTGGFTLIELMIVVAIIAIILTLGLPVYHDYAIRSKVGEALGSAAAAKTAVASICLAQPTIPAITEAITGYQFPAPTQYVASISLSGPCTQPVITIATRNTRATPNPVITLTGRLDAGRMEFNCATSGIFQHVPFDCRNALP